MSREVVQIEDAWTDPLYEQKAAVKISGGRSMIGVPLMREGEPIGVIGLARTRVDSFTQREIELVTTFADQAVIAIENARLFDELRESLDQQTATSEVLQVISSSPGDLERVFAAMLEKAVSICDATFGNIYRWQDGALHLVAAHNTPPALQALKRGAEASDDRMEESLYRAAGNVTAMIFYLKNRRPDRWRPQPRGRTRGVPLL
jgi:GAF domain-containing protein